jgi:cyclic pyranopterin phosphate synthase
MGLRSLTSAAVRSPIQPGPDTARPLIDGFSRRITYVRMSVTDRCDLRCRYCMAEQMEFLPNRELLTFDEIATLAEILIARGVRRIRLTGGEPLVRKGIVALCDRLGQHVGHGLDELTLTTNGTQLGRFAADLYRAGIRRVNVSLDTLNPELFRHITRSGDLPQVIASIDEAKAAGLTIKINMVALKGWNDSEFGAMMSWCAARGHDLTLIETMPLGDVAEDRSDRYLPLDEVKRRLEQRYTLTPSLGRTGGPARTFDVAELGMRLGFITPLTRNFCEGCNRIRVTATGTVFGCLGHDQKVELREMLRSGDEAEIDRALDILLAGKPKAHDFQIAASRPAVARHMSVTGG